MNPVPMSGVQIRGATPSDVAALLAMDTHLKTDPNRASAIPEWVRSGGCLVAELGDRSVGYTAVRNIFFHQPMIEILMVAAAHRRSGIGRALLRAALALAAADKVWTSTNRSNLPMQALLRAEGFVYAGMVEGLDVDDAELFYFRLK